MDSTTVSRAIRDHVRPALRDIGFSRFTGRNSWLDTAAGIAVVNFQSFSSHLAHGVGCTSYSFAVNLGLHRVRLDLGQSPRDPERPKEYECSVRVKPLKRLSQPIFHPYGRDTPTDRDDVWYVLPDGSNLDSVVDDARRVILEEALPALSRHDDPLFTYCELLNQLDDEPTIAKSRPIRAWWSARPRSPAWTDHVLALAETIGRDAEADIESPPQELISQVINSPQ